ncbi:sensor histidine kinase [Dyella sp. 2RAB6]|uniref:sensor histidine kinase n=1 Tax=Dyella sp. 2RAB6 TaxID=3232992 RepID=UPI003F9383EC
MAESIDPRQRPRFWLIHCGGWLGYGLVSALGALPYRNAFPVLMYFLGTTAMAFLASPIILAISYRLAVAKASWPRTFAVVIACAYPMGILCSTTGAALETVFGHPPAASSQWYSILFVGFANAFSPTLMLAAWAALYRGAWHWQEAQQRERQWLLAETLAREAELKALRYQITPHFLFNTLNGVSTLVGEGETTAARRMIALLADFLRSTLEPTRQGDVSMAKELTQVQQYIEIEQIRLGWRLAATVQCDADVLDTPVPHLLLQPLVENAIRHGIAPFVEGGSLSLAVTGAGDAVRIAIRNRAGGMPGKRLQGGGLGLANTRARLAARYGEDYRFAADVAEGGWDTVIDIPRHAAVSAQA